MMSSVNRTASTAIGRGSKRDIRIFRPKPKSTTSTNQVKDVPLQPGLSPIMTSSPRPALTLSASGDGCTGSTVACCRLCGSDQRLKYLDSTFQCDGVEERYDSIIHDCFGVAVPTTDCMICENCIVHLRNTHRFKALILAAFGKVDSEFSLTDKDDVYFPQRHNSKKRKSTRCQTERNVEQNTVAIRSLQIIRVQSNMMKIRAEDKPQKSIIQCIGCRHKYRMTLPQKMWKDFLCSRCKMMEEKSKWCKECQAHIAPADIRQHMAKHRKAKLNKKRKATKKREAAKEKTQPNQPITWDNNQNCMDLITQRGPNRKFECCACSRCFLSTAKLLDHINSEHKGDRRFRNCECVVCGKDMKTRTLLEKHMKCHTGEKMYQCNFCKQKFRALRWLNVHIKSHLKFKEFY